MDGSQRREIGGGVKMTKDRSSHGRYGSEREVDTKPMDDDDNNVDAKLVAKIKTRHFWTSIPRYILLYRPRPRPY